MAPDGQTAEAKEGQLMICDFCSGPDPAWRDPVVLDDPLEEHPEVQDARERVVDLVGDARRELTE